MSEQRALSKKSLAFELDASEFTVDEMAWRGVPPKALQLSPGCTRWSWEAVTKALAMCKTSSLRPTEA